MAAALGTGLEEEGYRPRVFASGAEGLAAIESHAPDAIILDLGLPDIDGIELLRLLRRQQCRAPILVLTARDAVAARVDALNAGADDYLIKPFAFEELLARLHALLRRAAGPRWAPLRFGDIELHAAAGEVSFDNAAVPLSPREYALLELLVRAAGDVIARADLLRDAFGYDFDPGTNLLDVHISHLRKKLRGAKVAIRTIRGVGFVLQENAS